MDEVFESRAAPWLAAAAVIVGGAIVGRLIARVIRGVLLRAARKSEAQWDDMLAEAMGGPFGAGLATVSMWVALPWLDIGDRARGLVIVVLTIATTVIALALLFRIVDLGLAILIRRSWAVEPATKSLLSVGARVVKLVLMVVAVITALAMFGVPVTSLVAGLGIGGLAIAFGAQKTIENLFGTVSIGADQPFHQGDFIKIGEVVGTVEAIGLRSTRIRTADRTLVTIPNGQLADARTESYTARDRFRVFTVLSLVYGTSAAQVRAIVADIEALLRAHPKLWQESFPVRFRGFAESALEIEVTAWLHAPAWDDFTALRQELLLGLMEIVERHGSAFAYPTRTLHVTSGTVARPAN